jgi:hypothetical protein
MWRSVKDDPPTENMAVLVFFANLKWRGPNGDAVSFGLIRDAVEKTQVGFFDDGDFCEAGTGHDMFEPWRDETYRPTHWMPLPEPPK